MFITVNMLQNPDYMKEGFEICIDTIHCPDTGTQENVRIKYV